MALSSENITLFGKITFNGQRRYISTMLTVNIAKTARSFSFLQSVICDTIWAGVHALWDGVHAILAGVHAIWAGVNTIWAGVHPGKVEKQLK
jgi:hypothetical protein